MHAYQWLELALFIGALILITKPLGLYINRVLNPNGRTWLDPILRPLEKLTYGILRVDPAQEQDWKHYSFAMLLFSVVSCLFTYIILRIQEHLPLNPQSMPALTEHLAFNTAISFTTNTNWQSYSGESTMSYFSQMVALVIHNFLSAATGIAIAAALVRGIARHTSQTIGNFWVDITRITYYLLLPICTIYALFLVSQGVIQNFKPYTTATVIEPQGTNTTQIIVQGPVASQIAIKMLGTNGGGYMNANAAHPFENPTPLSDFIQMLSIFAIGSALTYHLGRETKNQKHGWSVWTAMFVMFLAGVLLCWWAESRGNPIHHQLGVAAADGNMEGKEVRFGILESSLFATVTTDASCGAVNSMHDSFSPLGGLVPLVNMMLGEVVFGGVGTGLYSMLIFAIIGVFIAGLMIGRTPEYLGKKIEAFEMKMSSVAILVMPFIVLMGAAIGVSTTAGQAAVANPGAHGFSEILYTFTSAANNNGSAFAGVSVNTVFYNTILGVVMWLGRYWPIVAVLAVAGSLAAKKRIPVTAGTMPTHGPTFIILLIGTVLLVGALTFVPALALGPVVEHLILWGR